MLYSESGVFSASLELSPFDTFKCWISYDNLAISILVINKSFTAESKIIRLVLTPLSDWTSYLCLFLLVLWVDFPDHIIFLSWGGQYVLLESLKMVKFTLLNLAPRL